MIINIMWDGPCSLSEVALLSSNDFDFGLYQIYAFHPVYGKNLVYIGKAQDQTFAARIAQHNWASGSENDPKTIEAYIGRLIGNTPEMQRWKAEIDKAEKLLIHAHGPAYNTHQVHEPPGEADCGDVRIFNWGACRALSREISGAMWTRAAISLRSQTPYRKAQMPS